MVSYEHSQEPCKQIIQRHWMLIIFLRIKWHSLHGWASNYSHWHSWSIWPTSLGLAESCRPLRTKLNISSTLSLPLFVTLPSSHSLTDTPSTTLLTYAVDGQLAVAFHTRTIVDTWKMSALQLPVFRETLVLLEMSFTVSVAMMHLECPFQVPHQKRSISMPKFCCWLLIRLTCGDQIWCNACMT